MRLLQWLSLMTHYLFGFYVAKKKSDSTSRTIENPNPELRFTDSSGGARKEALNGVLYQIER
jgi:hypothetical protein